MTQQFESVDVLIIGAGLSGIDGACQLRRNCPDRSFMILESRAPEIGLAAVIMLFISGHS